MSVPAHSRLSVFDPVDPEEVKELIRTAPSKQGSLDSCSTRHYNEISCLHISPRYLTHRSLLEQYRPSSSRRPLIKKPARQHRTVSNLSVCSKLVEQIISSLSVIYLTYHNFYPAHQSAYRKDHLVETALKKVLADLIAAADSGNFALLVLLDLWVSFDTVVRAVLLTRIETSYGIGDNCLTLIRSYFLNRSHTTVVGGESSSRFIVYHAVGYHRDLYGRHWMDALCRGLLSHFHAESTQLQLSGSPENSSVFQDWLSLCD